MVYLTVVLLAWATSAATRVKRRPKLHIADSAMAAALLGITAESLMTPAETLGWFRDTVGERFELGIVLYAGEQALRLGDRLVALPISRLWAS